MAEALVKATPLTVNVAEQSRRFFRQLFSVIEVQRLTLQNLQAILRGSEFPGQPGHISLNDFTFKIQSLGQPGIEANLIRDVSTRFPGSPGMVSYVDFIRTATFEFDKYKLLDVIFKTLQEVMAALNVQTLRDLFSRLSPFSAPTIDKPTLDNVLKTVSGVQLQAYELDMVVLEYETATRGIIDFEQFDRDFREFQAGKSQLNSYMTRPNNQLMIDIRGIGAPQSVKRP